VLLESTCRAVAPGGAGGGRPGDAWV